MPLRKSSWSSTSKILIFCISLLLYSEVEVEGLHLEVNPLLEEYI